MFDRKSTNISGPSPSWNIEQPHEQTKSLNLSQLWNVFKGLNNEFAVQWFECPDGSDVNCDCPPDEYGKEYQSDGRGLCVRFADPMPELREAASGFVEVIIENSVPEHIRVETPNPVAWVSSEDDNRVIHINKARLPDASVSDLLDLVKGF